MSNCNTGVLKSFHVDKYVYDLDKIKILHKTENTNDNNILYHDFEVKVLNVINKHVPMKHWYPRKESIQYMNRELKKVIYSK